MTITLRFIAVIGVQIIAMLLLARVARSAAESLDGVSVFIFAALAYGIPALLAFIGCLRFLYTPLPRLRSRVLSGIVALFVAGFGHCVSLAALQSSDMWLTWRYIHRMRTQLHTDPRFKDVRLICYSDDFILFPYIPVGGSVTTEEDRKALDRILRESHPPAYASAVVVRVGLSPEELSRQPHEE